MGGVTIAKNAVLLQFPTGREIHRIADLFPAHRRRGDVETILLPRLAHHILQHKFRHGASANIAMAYE